MIDVLLVTSLPTLGTKIIHNQLHNNGLVVEDSVITENTVELIVNINQKY